MCVSRKNINPRGSKQSVDFYTGGFRFEFDQRSPWWYLLVTTCKQTKKSETWDILFISKIYLDVTCRERSRLRGNTKSKMKTQTKVKKYRRSWTLFKILHHRTHPCLSVCLSVCESEWSRQEWTDGTKWGESRPVRFYQLLLYTNLTMCRFMHH